MPDDRRKYIGAIFDEFLLGSLEILIKGYFRDTLEVLLEIF